MSWTINAVSTMHLGAALKTAEMLGLPKNFEHFVNRMVDSHRDLTSPLPLGSLEGLSRDIRAGAENLVQTAENGIESMIKNLTGHKPSGHHR